MQENFMSKIRNNWGWICVGTVLAGICAMVMIFGSNIIITAHDMLDDSIGRYKLLHDTNTFFAGSNTVLLQLGGIPRGFFPSELKAYVWPYMLLPPFYGIIADYLLKIIISATGFWFMGYVYYKDEFQGYKNITVVCGLLYGLIPSSPIWDLCFAIYPWMAAALLYCYQHNKWKLTPVFFLFAFFSELAHFGIFICGTIFIIFLVDAFRHKGYSGILLGALFFLALGYIVSEYRMFYILYVEGISTIRSEYVRDFYDNRTILRNIYEGFVAGQYHSASAHTLVILPVCMLTFLFLVIKSCKNRAFSILSHNPFVLIMIVIVANAVIAPLDYCREFFSLRTACVPFLNGVTFDRAIRLNSFLWYAAFWLVLTRYLYGHKRLVAILLAAAFLSIMGCRTMYNMYPANLIYMAKSALGKEISQRQLTYEEFYSEALFDKIKRYIGYKGEWCIAYGMHPSILTYNGMAALDGYHSWMPLENKRHFRRLIAPELATDEQHRNYFDDWGGRAYIFSKDIDQSATLNIAPKRAEIIIDPNVFREMQGKYVLSRVEISNAKDMQLKYLGCFTDERSPYSIFVYELD